MGQPDDPGQENTSVALPAERQHEILNELADLVDSGKLRTTLRQTLAPINAANLRQAHAQLESGTTLSKLVLAGW